MTDNEIVKALECCGKNPPICIECSYKGKCNRKDCYDYLKGDALSLINRQKAEIENYSHNNRTMTNSIYEMQKIIESQKAEIERLEKQLIFEIETAYDRGRKTASKEFAERVKRYIDVGHLRPPTEKCFSELDVVSMIDNLVKEMVGDTG